MRRLFSSPPPSVFRPCLRQPLSSSSSHLSLFFIPPPSPSARHTENTDEGRREEEGEEGKKRAGAGNEVRSLLLSPCSSWRGGRRQQNLLPLSFAQLLTHKSLMKTNVPPASRRRRVGGTVGVGRDPLPFPPPPLFSGPFPILQGLSPPLESGRAKESLLENRQIRHAFFYIVGPWCHSNVLQKAKNVCYWGKHNWRFLFFTAGEIPPRPRLPLTPSEQGKNKGASSGFSLSPFCLPPLFLPAMT